MSKQATNDSIQVLHRVMKWCSLRDRTAHETELKLNEVALKLGVKVSPSEVEDWLAELQESGYVDDRRCVASYVRVHAEHKAWGPLKIRAGLKGRGASHRDIEEGLGEMSDDQWIELATGLLVRRREELVTHRERVLRWMMGKGFPQHVVLSALERF